MSHKRTCTRSFRYRPLRVSVVGGQTLNDNDDEKETRTITRTTMPPLPRAKETTPLIAQGTRRRTVRQNAGRTNNNVGNGSDNEYEYHHEDDDDDEDDSALSADHTSAKSDRRSVVTKVLSFVTGPVLAGRERQRRLWQDEDYYEDTFNGLPWRCSFGTSEEVCVSTGE